MDCCLIPGRDGVGADPAVRRREINRESGGGDDALAVVVGALADVALDEGGGRRGEPAGVLRAVRVGRDLLPNLRRVRALLGEVVPVVGVAEAGGRVARRRRRGGDVAGADALRDGGRVLDVLRVGDRRRGPAPGVRLRREDVRAVGHVGRLQSVGGGDELQGGRRPDVRHDERGGRTRGPVHGAASMLRRRDELLLDRCVVVIATTIAIRVVIAIITTIVGYIYD